MIFEGFTTEKCRKALRATDPEGQTERLTGSSGHGKKTELQRVMFRSSARVSTEEVSKAQDSKCNIDELFWGLCGAPLQLTKSIF